MTAAQQVEAFLRNPQSDPEFARRFISEVRGQLPAEKERERQHQIAAHKAMQADGSTSMDGLGQRIGVVSARTFFRWAQEHPGFWGDKQAVAEFLKDNPQCRAPGYRPKASEVRHGVTFSGK